MVKIGFLDRAVPMKRLGAGRRRRLRNALASLDVLLLGPVQASTQRQELIRRAVVALIIISVLPIQQMQIPGWPAVVAGCAAALAYNIPLSYLTLRKRWYSSARWLGLILDSTVLAVCTLFVFKAMAVENSASEIWLVYVIYVVTGGFTMAPAGSLIYTGIWTGWLALATLLYFEPGTIYYDELPVRLVFLGAVGLIALALALELDKRRRRLEQQNRQTVGMLAKLVEARDTDAGAHLHRIQFFSRALASHLGFSRSEADEIAYASIVHDVGKANIPDSILKKAGPLTDEEWRVMQEHTVLGDQLLSENGDFDSARQVARWHHERWDGSGYPDGLRGEDIPLAARIVAVADVFDALISRRPYKEAWMPEEALLELKRLSSTHLDPTLVDAFRQLWVRGDISSIIAGFDGVASGSDDLAMAA
jgi:HD-GYP domain-containing protein (c-di-GMP phosphodiesterase class II)